MRSGTPSTRISPEFGSSRPQHHLQQGRLPAARGAGDRDIVAGSGAEINVAQHEGLALGIAEAKIAYLDIALDRRLIGEWAKDELRPVLRRILDIADFFRDVASNERDVISLQVVTM